MTNFMLFAKFGKKEKKIYIYIYDQVQGYPADVFM